MIQAGDPTGTGKGGQSIWGKPFPDEIRSTLKVGTSLRSILHADRNAVTIGVAGAYVHHSFPPTVQRPWRRRNGELGT
jgi:cyclophilin family peptidyl-prolyl cis-trans isomerase